MHQIASQEMFKMQREIFFAKEFIFRQKQRVPFMPPFASIAYFARAPFKRIIDPSGQI